MISHGPINGDHHLCLSHLHVVFSFLLLLSLVGLTGNIFNNMISHLPTTW